MAVAGSLRAGRYFGLRSAASSSTRRAALAIATSIILPSTVVLALPCASALSNASSTRA